MNIEQLGNSEKDEELVIRLEKTWDMVAKSIARKFGFDEKFLTTNTNVPQVETSWEESLEIMEKLRKDSEKILIDMYFVDRHSEYYQALQNCSEKQEVSGTSFISVSIRLIDVYSEFPMDGIPEEAQSPGIHLRFADGHWEHYESLALD